MKPIRHMTRDRYLTDEEAEEYRELRELIEKDRPEIESKLRELRAEKRQREAATRGCQTLGQRIRAAREAKGLSQVSLAETAGISQGYLSQLEQDEREPSLSIAARVARALGLSLDELAAEATVAR
jgi:DNA-binding XRE family transcriptional regulator